jgi:hypothetical protein
MVSNKLTLHADWSNFVSSSTTQEVSDTLALAPPTTVVNRAHSRRCWTAQVEPPRRGYRAAIILLPPSTIRRPL